MRTIKNLNDFAPGSPYLLIAGDINNSGRIAGYTGDGLGFLATPIDSGAQDGASNTQTSKKAPVGLRENVLRRLAHRWGLDD